MSPLLKFVFAACIITNFVAWRWAKNRIAWAIIRSNCTKELTKKFGPKFWTLKEEADFDKLLKEETDAKNLSEAGTP